MAEKSNTPAKAEERDIVLERVFDAPRELVWKAWTEPERIARWWGPKGFTTTTEEMDVRPGGVWRHVMHGPDGTDYPNRMVYIEVVEPERLVYTNDSGRDDDPGRFEATVLFSEEEGKTRVSGWMRFGSAEARDYAVREFGALEGAEQTLDRLAEYLQEL